MEGDEVDGGGAEKMKRFSAGRRIRTEGSGELEEGRDVPLG